MTADSPPPDLTVVVCRGCCCGTTRKHPGLDHAGQVAALARAAEAAGGRLRQTDCLGPCDRSNVMVVRSRTAAASATVWLGGVLEEAQTAALCAWIAGGAPASLPEPLAPLVFRADDDAAAFPIDPSGLGV
jgi:hypothetical protein